MSKTSRRLLIVVLVVLAIAAIWFVRAAGTLLIVDRPAKADLIVVLAGDQNEVRFRRAVQLWRTGYAPDIQMDANNTITFFGKTNEQWAADFMAAQPPDLRPHLSVCGMPANSTREEFLDARACLARKGARRILVVTSDFHTRRSFDIARRVAPGFTWSVAAAPTEVSQRPWWRNRNAARNVLEEWQKFIWWKLVESHRHSR